jgi:hypothetical protein
MPSILSTHPIAATIWHPTKNGDRTPANTTRGQHVKIWILMPCKHEGCDCPHEYETCPSNIFRKDGTIAGCGHCCTAPKHQCKHKMIAHTHPEIAAQWHPTKNGALTPKEFSHGSNVDIWWLCPIKCEHGCLHEWRTSINMRCGGQECGCPFCVHQKVCIHNSIVTTESQIAAEWDYKKNIELDPTTIARSSNRKAYFLCPSGHSYCSIVGNRCLHGYGCPACKHKTQKFIYEFLKSRYPDTDPEFKLEETGLRRFDFCIPSLRIIIEVDGPQHFMQVMNWQSADDTRAIDIYKTRAALAAGFNVIRISQKDVHSSSFRGDGTWTTDALLSAIENASRTRIQYISRDPEMYRAHVDALPHQLLLRDMR